MKNKVINIHLSQISIELGDEENNINEARMAVWVRDNPMASYEDYYGMCVHFNTVWAEKEDYNI